MDCVWGDWSMSSTCSKTCGTGKQLQTRTIITHEENGGSACSGENIQEIDCNADACPTGNCITTKNYYGSFCYIILLQVEILYLFITPI